VNGSGDQLSEQSRPLLQIEDLRVLTSGQNAHLHGLNKSLPDPAGPDAIDDEEIERALTGLRGFPASFRRGSNLGATKFDVLFDIIYNV
jgi:type IV secretion system protein VirD4